MQVKGILFDLDGTLLDSMKIWDTIGNDYLSSLGIETEENLTETFRYMSLQQSAEYYQSVYHVKKSTDQIISEINKMVEDFYKEQAELKSGVRKILETCSKRNIKMCIATAIDRYIVDAALSRLGIAHYFAEIIACNEVGYGKDSIEFFSKALSVIGTEKEDTLVFDDAFHAVETAKRAGFQVVGVYDASEPEQEKIKALADYYIENFADIEF